MFLLTTFIVFQPGSVAIEHNLLKKKLGPLTEMHRLVKSLALQRLRDDNSSVDVMALEPVQDITTRFYQNPEEYAMSHYAYYPCSSCSNVSTTAKCCLRYTG